ncbi:MAG: DUF6599 family protein [Thermoanaerobaculia bacterium]
MTSRVVCAVVIAAALLFPGCRNEAPPSRTTRAATTPAQTFVTIESPSMQFLPRQQEAAGWLLEEDPLVFPAEQIPTYLSRDARHFQLYDVVDLTVGSYRRVSGPGFASVEIFRFPDFVKAFGAYSSRRAAVVNYLDIGNESFVGPHSIHIWRGPFYVRIIGGGAANLIEPLKELASTVAEVMPEASGKPAVFNFLPAAMRVVNSERFLAEGAFGQPYLANAFVATFAAGDQQAEGLILPAPSKKAAEAILAEYEAFFASNGRLLDPIPNLGEDNFTGEDRYQGRTIAFRIDRFVIAFKGYGDRDKLTELAIATDQRILGTIRAQLQSAEKRAEKAAIEGDDTSRPGPSWAPPGTDQ